MRYKFFQYPRGVNKGGVLNTEICPTISCSSWAYNCFLIEICDTEENTSPLRGGISRCVKTDDSLAVVVEPNVLTPKRTEFGKAVRKQYENRELNMSRHAMQRLEPRKDGVANTLTSVQKDNLVAMPLRIAEATAQGCQQGVVVTPINPDGECSRTIKAQYQQSSRANFVRQDGLGATGVMECRYRIRKLTPRECFRLMGVDDKDIDTIQASGISNSQQYKCAGNSIVVDVLYHLFRKLFVETGNEKEQMTLF